MTWLLGFALVAASVGAGPAGAASPIWPQPQQYSAHLRYDEHHAVLAGRERITFLNDGPRSLSSVWLRVWPNGYGSCKRRYARVSVTAGGAGGGWKVGCTALRVRLAHPVGPGASGSVGVRLRVKVPKNNDRFGRVGSTVYLGNALPLLDVEDSSGPSLEPYIEHRRSVLLAGCRLVGDARRAALAGGRHDGLGDRAPLGGPRGAAADHRRIERA